MQLNLILDQKWWKDKLAAEKPKTEPEKKAAAAPATRGRGGPARGRGAAAAPRGRGAPAARGASAPRGRGVTAVKGGRGKGVTAPTASSSQTKCDKKSEPAAPVETEKVSLM